MPALNREWSPNDERPCICTCWYWWLVPFPCICSCWSHSHASAHPGIGLHMLLYAGIWSHSHASARAAMHLRMLVLFPCIYACLLYAAIGSWLIPMHLHLHQLLVVGLIPKINYCSMQSVKFCTRQRKGHPQHPLLLGKSSCQQCNL